MPLLSPEGGVRPSLLWRWAPAQEHGESTPTRAARNAKLAQSDDSRPRRLRQTPGTRPLTTLITMVISSASASAAPTPTSNATTTSAAAASAVVTEASSAAPTTTTTTIPFAFGALMEPIPSTATAAAQAAQADATQSAAPVGPTLPGPTASLTGGENYIGAIVGSVAAFLFIVMLVWCCLLRPRRRRAHRRARDVEVVYRAESRTSSVHHTTRRGERAGSGTREVRGGGGPGGGGSGGGGWAGFFRAKGPVLNQPPPRVPPTRYAGYTTTETPQMPGVRRYP